MIIKMTAQIPKNTGRLKIFIVSNSKLLVPSTETFLLLLGSSFHVLHWPINL